MRLWVGSTKLDTARDVALRSGPTLEHRVETAPPNAPVVEVAGALDHPKLAAVHCIDAQEGELLNDNK